MQLDSTPTFANPVAQAGARRHQPGIAARLAALRLSAKLYALLMLAALPLTGLSAYQAFSGWHNSRAIAEEFPRYLLAMQREAQFKTFVDGVADAVDSGSLSDKAAKAAQEAARLSQALQALQTPDGGPAASPASDLDAVAAAVAQSRQLPALLPLRQPIQRAQALIAEQAQAHRSLLDGVVTGSITGAHRDALIARLASDSAFASALAAATTPADAQRIAAEHGFDVTPGELAEASAERELSDADLEGAAGGNPQKGPI